MPDSHIENIVQPDPNGPPLVIELTLGAAPYMILNDGAPKLVKHWHDDVPEGEVTSLPKAVQCKPDETVVFSWISWPSKEARDTGMRGVMSDPVMEDNPMPFDGTRMIYGGFDMIVET